MKRMSVQEDQVHLLRPAFIRTIIINPHNQQLCNSSYKMHLMLFCQSSALQTAVDSSISRLDPVFTVTSPESSGPGIIDREALCLDVMRSQVFYIMP
tara:strand:+ start:451 stop:741 length:291 start_codon:yes stop_codon:yes gene_type:complete